MFFLFLLNIISIRAGGPGLPLIITISLLIATNVFWLLAVAPGKLTFRYLIGILSLLS